MQQHGNTIAERKQVLRAAVRATRAARTAADRAAVAAALAEGALSLCRDAGVIAAYASFGGEPGTHQLRAALRGAGVTVLLPVVRGTALAWVADDGAALLPGGKLAIPEPAGDAVGIGAAGLRAAGAGVLLLPALAVSGDGIRLGQGGGYYDRVLAALPAHPEGPLRVAVLHEDEVLERGAVPADTHDRAARVDAVLTQAGSRRLG